MGESCRESSEWDMYNPSAGALWSKIPIAVRRKPITDPNSPDTESQGHSDLGIPRDVLVPVLQSPATHMERQTSAVSPRMTVTVPKIHGIRSRRPADPHLM